MKIKSFECKSIRNYEKKKNSGNVRQLVDELFIPSAQQPEYYIVDCQFLFNFWPHSWKIFLSKSVAETAIFIAHLHTKYRLLNDDSSLNV